MASLLSAILRQASRREEDKLNILTFPTHERYETGLAATGHNFYAYRGDNIKDWNETYAKLPSNYVLLPKNAEPPLDIDFDIVLSQNKFGQFPIAQHFSKVFHCPLISLEHTLPPHEELKQRFAQMKGDVNVFISEYSVDAWGFHPMESVVIHHGIDTDTFIPAYIDRQKTVLSVVNDWINRDWCCGYNLWREIVEDDIPVTVVGNTPGLSEPAGSIQELAFAYQKARVFLNTSLISPVPTALLEAMASGCAVVSTATCMIPNIIHHGVNGFISNNAGELKSYCKLLLDNPSLAKRLGNEARRTIENRFSQTKFISEWDNLFKYASENLFVKE